MTRTSQTHLEEGLIHLLGVRVDDCPLDRLLQTIADAAQQGRRTIISNVNIQAVNIAFEHAWYRDFLNNSDLAFCDGFGIWIGALLVGRRLHYRYTPPDFIDIICNLACQNSYRIFFLGAKEGVAEKAASRLRKKFPALQIGTHHGFFNKIKDSIENQKIIETINSFGTNILVVGMGMPIQEQWILDNLEKLKINVAFPAGALFDYVSGEQIRAPRWMTGHGLEWLGRLIIEPRRLWRRYIIGNPLFLWRIFIHEVLRIPLPG